MTRSARRLFNRAGRVSALIVVSCLAATAATAIAASPAIAAPAKPKEAKDLPALPAAAQQKARPDEGRGDFENPPPHPDNLEKVHPSSTTFDPARATVIDSETTATRKSYRGSDGTRTDVLSLEPVRYQDEKGVWRDIDTSLVAGGDGSFAAKAAPSSARVPARADGPVVLATPKGPIAIRHQGAAAIPGTAEDSSVTYVNALGRRDLRLALTAEGVEDFVVLPDAGAGSSYVLELSLPGGLAARDGAAGVEIVDGGGQVVAAISNGWAADSRSGIPALSPVNVHLVSPDAPGNKGAVALDVSVDPAWLADPARQFPVTIDPSSITFNGNLNLAQDAMVINGANANVNFGTYPELWEAVDGTGVARSYIRFDGLGTPSDQYWVTNATLSLYKFTANCSVTTPPALEVMGPKDPWSESTLTWNSQPAVEAGTGTTTPTPSCNAAGAWVNVDVTWLAWMWLHGTAPNNGVMIKEALESDPTARSRQFYSTEGTAGFRPSLTITYGVGTPTEIVPAATSAPADGAVLSTTTPTLAVNKAADPNVRYWFRATPAPDAETGAKVIDSGWLTAAQLGCASTAVCSYAVPAGLLVDGVTYSWHSWTWDNVTGWHMADWVRTFTVDLHLGADSLPVDQVGPVQVNLASGNVALSTSSPTFEAVGGPVGLSYSYNSAAPSSSAGLLGSYFVDTGLAGHPFPAAAKVVRTDPNVVFWWQGTAPAPGVPNEKFMARWEGDVTIPNAGDYRFGAQSDDGVRIWIGGTKVVDRWVDQSSWPASNYGVPVRFNAGETKSIKIEYYQNTGFSFMQLAVQGPFGPAGADLAAAVPGSWLSHKPSGLPSGWTLSVAGAPYASVGRFDRSLVLTDPSGAATTYPWSGAGAGFAPASSADGTAAIDGDGFVSVTSDGGARELRRLGRRVVHVFAPR